MTSLGLPFLDYISWTTFLGLRLLDYVSWITSLGLPFLDYVSSITFWALVCVGVKHLVGLNCCWNQAHLSLLLTIQFVVRSRYPSECPV